MKPIPPSARVLLPLTFLVMCVAPTGAETLRCRPIAAVPYTITTPGAYCLTRDLIFSASSGTEAIRIQASNVLLDFNGHRLAGPANVYGIVSATAPSLPQENLTIRNGTVHGFYIGIHLARTCSVNNDHRGHVIEEMRVTDSHMVGILVEGRGTVVRDNQIVGIGTSTGPNLSQSVAGIVVCGAGARVLDNDIARIIKPATGDSFGILAEVTKDALVERNRITEADIGVSFNGADPGKYRDNLTSSVTTPYSGHGTDAGNNH